MYQLFLDGQFGLAFIIIVALTVSLGFHEFGHAAVAKLYGDDTAQRAGRLTLNPWAHIDPMGLLMVVLIGIGYAKPVPTDPRNFTSRYADLWVAAAGPFMNLLLAFVSWNIYQILLLNGLANTAVQIFCTYLAGINLLLMLFNLIPLGPLDGHYIMPYLLPEPLARRYTQLNARYGTAAFLVLIVLSFWGLPLLQMLNSLAASLLDAITLV